MPNIKLFPTDYIILDEDDDPISFINCGLIVIYGSKEEAEKDCSKGHRVVSCTQASVEVRKRLLKQISPPKPITSHANVFWGM